MADVNKSIAINYTADTSKLEKALKRIPRSTAASGQATVREMDSNFRKMERTAIAATKKINARMKSIGKNMAQVGAAVGAVAIGTVALGQKFADLTNELTDASTKTGIAVDTLAGLRLAAEGSGLSFQSLESGLIRFQGAMDQASRGSKQMSDVFGELGIDVKTSTGELRDADTVFNEVVKTLGEIENTTERNSKAMLLFGRSSGPALIQSGALDNLQSMSKLATEFGVNIDEKGIGAMARFQRSMASFETVAIGTFQSVIDSVAGGSGGDSLAMSLDFVTEKIVFFGSVGRDVVAAVGQSFENLFGIIQMTAMAMSGETEQAKNLLADLVEESDDAMDNFTSMFSRAAEEVEKFNSVSAGTPVPKKNKEIETTAEDAESAVDGLADSLDDVVIDDDVIEKLKQIGADIDSDLRQPIDDANDRFNETKIILDDIGDKLNSEFDTLIDLAGANAGLNDAQTARLLELSDLIEQLETEQTANLDRHERDRAKIRQETQDQILSSFEDQRAIEEEIHAAAMERNRERIDQLEMFGTETLNAFTAITTAISDVNQAEIDRIREQTDEQIDAIDKMNRNGVISSEEAARRRTRVEEKYEKDVQKFREKSFKASQAAAIADVVFQGAIASTRAIADYGIPAGLVVAGLAAAATTAQIVSIKSQAPPKFDVGGMVGANDPQTPDQVRADLLTGEAVLDRSTVRNLGGEQGVRDLRNGSRGDRVIVVQPFKHFDRFVKNSGINSGRRRSGIGGY